MKMFIQNVHHYRDECLRDPNPPVDHVALFDEAQRAWNREQTTKFMRQKKGQASFDQSEPEFLLSCIDRHPDWGVVVCLVGGGQEINTGEAGISEWIAALNQRFPDWRVHISDRLTEAEFAAGEVLKTLAVRDHVHYDPRLHLSVSMRSFRAEHVSQLVKYVLDLDEPGAKRDAATDRRPVSRRSHSRFEQSEDVAADQGTGQRTVRHCGLVRSIPSQTAGHRGPLETRSRSLVFGGQRRYSLVLPFGRRFNRVRDPGARIGLGVRHLGC